MCGLPDCIIFKTISALSVPPNLKLVITLEMRKVQSLVSPTSQPDINQRKTSTTTELRGFIQCTI